MTEQNAQHDAEQPRLSGFAAQLAENTADSAGQAWEGRSFQQPHTDYSNDDGSRAPEIAEAFLAFADGRETYLDLLSSLSQSRVLIPLLAVAGDEGYNEHGLKVDKTQELSIVTVQGPDGRNVLPVFTDVPSMNAWNSEARPVPVEFVRAALAAADEDTEIIVVNPRNDEEIVVRRPALWAIAKQELDSWLPSFADEDVLNEFASLSEGESHLVGLQLMNADPLFRLQGPELGVVLALKQGLNQEELQELLARLQTRWMESSLIRERVDSLTIKLVAAT